MSERHPATRAESLSDCAGPCRETTPRTATVNSEPSVKRLPLALRINPSLTAELDSITWRVWREFPDKSCGICRRSQDMPCRFSKVLGSDLIGDADGSLKNASE